MNLLETSPAATMETVTTALKTAMTSVANGAMGAIGDILPIALPVMGAIVVVGIGVKVFKKFVK